jgi:catalase
MTAPQKLTTSAGVPVGDNQNSLSAGPRGPLLLQDYHLVEKLAQFNRERIPERVVHAKGSAAYGTFTVTQDISKYSAARLFEKIGKQTPVFLRFSTVGGEKGSADTERDPRGFAVKFYTEEGNWDMVGNNTPVFFIRDPSKFPDFVHTQKRDPQTNLKSPTMMWDFWSISPESLHQVTILFSDRGTPDGYRFMHGFSSHTFSLVNARSDLFWVKWHFKSLQGIRNLSPADAVRLAGEDPDYAQRDLFNAIEQKNYPKWRVCVQVMPEKEADAWSKKTDWNPFDLTKIWPYKDYPLIEVGVMELNRNPENYFAEVEQAAFAPTNIVPGMGFSPDKMLQGRIFAYPDAHRYRIGANFNALPVNAPKCPFHTNHRDGAMRFEGNGGAARNYEPSNFSVPAADPRYNERPYAIGAEMGRFDHRKGNDDYSQAGDLFRLMNPAQKQHLIDNIVGAMKTVPRDIQLRQIGHFLKADPAYGKGVANGLGIDEKAIAKLAA